ncbi:unnamed protein product [Arabidopsis thaliana]|uniref:60S acidic ribosomal protein family n=1 Tax=Arabidopsis thaliana TaxID=3702 RepID=A0A5S9XH45_ARATH|nr:unnamed protein product [Arabidopsis thaliana]
MEEFMGVWHLVCLIFVVGAETEDSQIEILLKEVKGKDLAELIAVGREQLALVPYGGGGGVVASAPSNGGGGGGAPAAASKKEEKKEDKEESDDVIMEELSLMQDCIKAGFHNS